MLEEKIENLFAAVYPEMMGEMEAVSQLPGGVEVQDALSLLPGMRLEEAAYQARIEAAMKFGISEEDDALVRMVECYEALISYLCHESFLYGYKIGLAEGDAHSESNKMDTL